MINLTSVSVNFHYLDIDGLLEPNLAVPELVNIFHGMVEVSLDHFDYIIGAVVEFDGVFLDGDGSTFRVRLEEKRTMFTNNLFYFDIIIKLSIYNSKIGKG